MYRVDIYNSSQPLTIHEPTEDPNDPHLYECKLVQSVSGEIDSLSFKILPDNPGYDQLNCYTTMIRVVDTTARPESAEFVGRVLTAAPNMEESGLVYKSVVCEDRLGYLCDSVQPYVAEQTYYGDSEKTGVQKFVELLLDNHNAQVEDAKKIYPGTISFNTSSGNVTKGLNYQTTWDAIREKLLNDLGGEIQLYSFDGKLYLDYVPSLGTYGEQVIEVAKNMRTATQDESPSDIITRLIPLGDYKDDESGSAGEYERINISSVNNGKLYLDDEDAIATFGIIEGTIIWEDVTLPENLLEKGKEWLENQTVEDSLTLSAYDLYLIGIDPDQITPANWYEVKNPLIGLDRYYRCVKRTTNVCDPVDKTYEMGAQNKSLASSVSSNGQSAKDAADAAASINANLSKTVNTLIAGNALILYLEATVADIAYAYIDRAEVEELLAGYATIQYLIDYYASIEYLEANYASITDLDAAFANVELLNADVANIKNLLAGNMGTGDFQTIILTTDNAYIEEAVIVNALMDTVLASVLTAGIIYTDYIKIANNEDQSLWIDGSTMQFTDENGTVRVQIGLDASGNYSYYLWDENGTLIWDAMGLTEAGLTGNGAIIKDAAVADDANISGYKLNIDEVTQILNAQGQLIMDASQVIIDGNTLDYQLTQITQQIDNLEAIEGVESIENYYAIGTADKCPPFEWEDEESAILGEAILGEMVLGVNGESNWTTEQPTAGEDEYIWFAQKVTYVNGDILWTTPTLLTDYYVRNAITIQQTELEVVQGQIQAKIWMSDIETIEDELTTIITDQYGILTVLIDAIDARVGQLTTTVDENYSTLYSYISALTLDYEGIYAEVREVYEKTSNAIIEGTPYYATSDSPDYYPPFEIEPETTAILGQGILGEMILGETGASRWTTKQPAYKEGQYTWIAYLRTRADGSTYWTEPTLLTDEWIRENTTQMQEEYSELTMTVNSISAEVVNVWSELALNYSTTQEIKAIIDVSVSEESSTILQEVSYTYATMGYVDDALSDIDLDAVKYIDTYYAVSDSDTIAPTEGDPIVDADFGTGIWPDGWSGSNSAEFWTDGPLGACLALTNPSASTCSITYTFDSYLPIGTEGKDYGIRILAATLDGQEESVDLRYGFSTNSGASLSTATSGEIYKLPSEEWKEIDDAFSTKSISQRLRYFNVYSANAKNTTILVKSILVYLDNLNWSTTKPDVSDEQYLWIKYKITYTDGHFEWTDPTCTMTPVQVNASISSSASSTMATIRSEVSATYATLSGLETSMAVVEQYADGLVAKIGISVSGGIGNVATITLSTDGGPTVQELDLTKVREAFANDKSAVTISAGTVTFISNTLLITSNQFTLDADGNATFSGNLSAPSGTIGGWTIGSKALYNGPSSYSDNETAGIYLGTDGFAFNGSSTTVTDQRTQITKAGAIRQYDISNDTRVDISNGRITLSDSDGSWYSNGGFSLRNNIIRGYHGNGGGSYSSWFSINNENLNVVLGSTSSSGATLIVNGSSITGSDESLKKGLTPVEDPEAFTGERDYDKVVNSLEPVTFQYQQETGTKKHIGFTYQNAVQALEDGGIDPDECAMVQETTDPDTGETTGGIEYNDIVALLVYEIKKLKSEIQEMKGE